MDLQKEREAFEDWYFNKHYAWTAACRSKVFEKFQNLKGAEKPYSGEYINNRVALAWEAWQAAKAQAVPEGFVLAPKEPTEAMVEAGKDSSECGGWPDEIYKAMIEAMESAND